VLQPKPRPYLTTVKTLEESSVRVWEGVAVQALFFQIPRLRENAYAIASGYVAKLADLLVARVSLTAKQRLLRALVDSVRQIGHASTQSTELVLTNEELAEMADVSLFTASRQLSEWHSQGILAKSRGKILLRAPQRLVGIHLGANDLHWNENEAARIPFADSSAYP
jgi:CRP-like cAMP-binding protein